MSCEEKVSVIIPVYNVKEYLDDCISSVCKQTYENIEIIIVDDGATDGSAQICDCWKEYDDRIVVIHQKNSGVSAARNTGVTYATGKYVWFVDSDDIVDENLLKETIPHMADGTEMVAFGYRIVYGDREAEYVCFPGKEYLLKDDDSKANFIIGPFFRYEVGWNVWNRIFLKEYIDKYEIEFVDVKKVSAEDQLFCLCYLAHCSKIKVLDSCLYDYIQRDDSYMNMSAKAKNYHIAQKNELSIVLYNYLDKWKECHFLLERYPAIHYLLLERPIQKKEYDNCSITNIGKSVRNDINEMSDISFFDEQMKLFLRNAKMLKNEYSSFSILKKRCRANECVTCKSTLYRFMMIVIKACKR